MRINLAIILLCLSNVLSAQERNPVHWRIHSDKIAEATYEIHFSAFIESKWHIYAQANDSNVAMPTAITFDSNASIEVIGKPREIGVQKVDSASGTAVRYYENEVDFVETVRLNRTSKTVLSGTISWMACTERCLPEADWHFSIAIGSN